ncbi:MAG: sugar ABC transporter permease [Candidatus Tectomicrobia bacterium]|nr:sugar ABC transporter permease [Candidatus Tectomicrobia bacterium]
MIARRTSIAVEAPFEVVAKRKPARLSHYQRETIGGLFLLAPALLILLGLVVYPFLYAVWLSFFDKSVGTVANFVGFGNFRYVMAWPQFSAALYNTAVFTIVAVAIKFVLGMSVAVVLNQHIRGRNFFRAFLLLPWVMPAFVVYLTWRWLYDPLQGLLNYAMLDLGLITRPIAFLSTKETAMISVIIAHAWRGFPFYAISFLAGMQTIPPELYEAANVDGASRWQQFRYITLPGLYHIIGVVLLLSTIWTANAFEPVYLLTGGGPSDATTVYTMLVYLVGMINFRLGEAAAVSVLFLPLLIGLVLVVTGLLQRRGEA